MMPLAAWPAARQASLMRRLVPRYLAWNMKFKLVGMLAGSRARGCRKTN
jgi:hypothetical protein